MPFAIDRRDGILTLTLDTPRAEVNIFNRATAEQTLALLAEVRPEDTRAIVFRTAKVTSFINGVGMLLSTSVKNYDEVMSISDTFRRAYLAVRTAPVPTIAIVEGMCWGCGVEFLLNCRHRLAIDTYDTQFRMTELQDYFEVPIFRSCANLPPTVGLPETLDFLMWGQRRTAREALERGLVHELAAPQHLEEGVRSFVARVLSGAARSGYGGTPRPWQPADDQALAQSSKRIDDLPPAVQQPYREALALIKDGARHEAGEAHFEANYRATSDCDCSSRAKQAYGFFHIRRMATVLSAPEGPLLEGEVRLALAEAPEGVRALLIPEQPLAHLRVVEVDERNGGTPSGDWARFVPAGSSREDAVVVALDPLTSSLAANVLHRPLPSSRFVELRERERGALRPLAGYLRRLGFEVAVSLGGPGLGATMLLARFLAPLVAALLDAEHAESPATLERSLRDFGFVRRPAALLAGAALEPLVQALRGLLPEGVRGGNVQSAVAHLATPAHWETGENRPAISAALTISLLCGVLDQLDDSGFRHPSLVDLAARELLDYPLLHSSLCSSLTRARVADAVATSAARPLVRDQDLQRAAAFAAGTRSFYR